jgi:D-alanyl-lipoteichoic acid acyltransferase DltB (MBOAT superfamily)
MIWTKADIQPEDYRKRVSTSLPENEYSLLNFVAYCLYPPLYIAGPIITFNDFIWQVRLLNQGVLRLRSAIQRQSLVGNNSLMLSASYSAY